MKLLHAGRQSRLADSSTGIEKQDEQAHTYAKAYGHELIWVVADENVSGDTDPFTRPGLGPWLTQPELMERYDGIIAAFLDRLGRNARHLAHLREWAEDNNKKLIVVNPHLTWPVEPGDVGSKVMWEILSTLAEYELDMIKRRSADTRKKLIRENYLVGRRVFGFRIVKRGDHKTLEPDDPPTNPEDRDPEHIYEAPYVREMVKRYLDGETLSRISAWLDEEGVKPVGWAAWYKKPTDTRGPEPIWSYRSVSQILRNPILTGRQKEKEEKEKPKAQRNPNKAPPRTILRVPPILEISVWEQVQALLDANSNRMGVPSGETAMLTGILHCLKCGRPMYRTKIRRGFAVGYYCKPQKKGVSCKNLLPVGPTEAAVDDWIIEAYGQFAHTERLHIPGNNHNEELNQNRLDIQDLDPDDPRYVEKHAALMAEREKIKELPIKRPHVERQAVLKPDGEAMSIAEYWSTLDDQGKRRYLLDLKLRIVAEKDKPTGRPLVGIQFGDELFGGTASYEEGYRIFTGRDYGADVKEGLI